MGEVFHKVYERPVHRFVGKVNSNDEKLVHLLFSVHFLLPVHHNDPCPNEKIINQTPI